MSAAFEPAGVAPAKNSEIVYDASLWANVACLLDRAPRDSDLRFHGLELLAARHARRLGHEIPVHTLAAERSAAAASLIAPLVLQRVLAAVEGPVVLMKGAEVAQWYENPLTRPYRDIDVLVEDADTVWNTLCAAGFEPTGDPELYVGIHHLRPLVWPGLPLVVEIHHEPKWVEQAVPPTRELLETAVPSATGIPGLLALEPARHAVALAVHAWAHVPLSRLGRLLDVAALTQGSDPKTLDAVARSWGVERLWRTTHAATDSLFREQRRPVAGGVWARHLWSVRERTVIERHLERWLGPFSALPPLDAARVARHHVAQELAREPGETRGEMVRRSIRAMTNAFQRQSVHDEGAQTAGPPKDWE